MGKVKYTDDVIQKAVELRIAGYSIPEIIETTGIKKPSLQKIFQERSIKLDPEQKAKALARRWLNHEPIQDSKKLCSKCEEWRAIEEFHKDKNSLTGLLASCKDCYSLHYRENAEIIKSRVSKYRDNNPEKIKQKHLDFYKNNKEYCAQKANHWAEKNPEKRKEITNNYGKRTQKQKNARTAKYRAIKIQATPPWISEQQLDEISRIYINCPPGYHVDHIVPLRGKGVRGLHVPWNLQYLPALENMSKGNKLKF